MGGVTVAGGGVTVDVGVVTVAVGGVTVDVGVVTVAVGGVTVGERNLAIGGGGGGGLTIEALSLASRGERCVSMGRLWGETGATGVGSVPGEVTGGGSGEGEATGGGVGEDDLVLAVTGGGGFLMDILFLATPPTGLTIDGCSEEAGATTLSPASRGEGCVSMGGLWGETGATGVDSGVGEATGGGSGEGEATGGGVGEDDLVLAVTGGGFLMDILFLATPPTGGGTATLVSS